MLMSKYFLIPCAEITHALSVRRLDVAVKIRPAKTSEIARRIGAVVSQQKNGITDNVLVGVLDADVAVGGCDVLVGILLESLLSIVCEDYKWSGCLKRQSLSVYC